MKTKLDPEIDPMYAARLASDPGHDPSSDADHEARRGELESTSAGLLASAERRTSELLRRPFSRSVARAVCLFLRTEARGSRVPLRAFHPANEAIVRLQLDGLSVEVGRGSEGRRRQTLKTIREWCAYWGSM